jgi:uncharacterized protein (TIGR03067 family)
MSIRVLTVLPVCLGILAIAAGDDGDAARKDLDGLQGEWTLVSAIRDGKEMPAERVAGFKNTIKGDAFSITSEGKTAEEGSIKLDPTKKPREVAFILARGEKTALGIYELSGDTCKLCYAPPGQDRPKAFAAKEGTGHTLSVWKRKKL